MNDENKTAIFEKILPFLAKISLRHNKYITIALKI